MNITNTNICVNYFLYIAAFFFLFLYLAGRYRGKFLVKYYYMFLSLLFVYIAGTLIALLRGIGSNNPAEFIYSDLLRSMVFPLALAFAGLISGIKNIKFIKKITLFFILIFVGKMLLYKSLEFIFLGDIFKSSTVQTYNLSFIGFFGFYLLANRNHKNIGRLIILSSWGIALLSLAKWNFFPMVIFPLLWIIIETKRMNTKRRVILCIISIIFFTSVLFRFRNDITCFASKGHYNNWQAYWYTRVVAENLAESGHIRPGGRYKIWGDLLQQFSKNPLLGIGFGARPTFLNIEDHSMYIFFLVRFGIPLFCIAAILSLILLIHILRYQNIGGTNRLILIALFAFFFFTAAVGSCFGQILNGLTVGLIAGIILNSRGGYPLIKEKR